MIIILLSIVILFNIVEPVTYNVQNASKMFDFYKSKYNRQYLNKIDEANGMLNFVNNLNKVTQLNENATDKFHLYQLNGYADTDPKDFEKHFGVHIDTYDNVLDATSGKLLRNANTKREYLPKKKLFDLTKADELYRAFQNRYHKKNYTNKRDRTIHYYRFIKTLVEINKEKLQGNPRPLEEDADELKQPYEYFY